MIGPLDGVRVLDLSRVLAGPTCTQLLGDLGADVLKVERPGHGDDTRRWGPPFVTAPDGHATEESAYYLSANRNKRSIAVDFGAADGATILRRLAARADVLVENFKVGTLARAGLDYESLRGSCPRLVYCSITGFGQTGPRAAEPGYDFLVQALGGIMSLTGAPGGPPTKVGVAVADVMCGMYAATGVLAALRHRDATGAGQHVDLALFDTQLAWLVNGATNYLVGGEPPRRWGNAHPNIVPYRSFETADGHLVLAVGNDAQFRRFCAAAELPWLAEDPRFATNAQRVDNRDALLEILGPRLRAWSTAAWLEALREAQVPAGPVHRVEEALDDPQTHHRAMRVTVTHGSGTPVELLGNPLKLSETPVAYRAPPPRLGEHTDAVLREELGADEAALARWRERGVIG